MAVAEGDEARFSLRKLPMGYRFLPTDEELVVHYLINKALYRPLPADAIPDIRESEFYSSPPSDLVMPFSGERQRFFFIHSDENFHGDLRRTTRMVGNGIGFWKLSGQGVPIYSPGDENISAFKFQFTYFSGPPPAAKRTHWRMEEYRLPIDFYLKNHMKGEGLALGRIRRSKEYDGGL